MNRLSNEIITTIFSFLSAKDLVQISSVSKTFHHSASENTLWTIHLDRLWSDKVYIPKKAKEIALKSCKWAYFYSILDSKRFFMTAEDLIDCEQYSFRFKSTSGMQILALPIACSIHHLIISFYICFTVLSGEDWTQHCPWNQGLPASTVSFLDGGEIKRHGNDSMQQMYTYLRLTWKLDRKHKSPRKCQHILDFLELYDIFDSAYNGHKYLKNEIKLGEKLQSIGDIILLTVRVCVYLYYVYYA